MAHFAEQPRWQGVSVNGRSAEDVFADTLRSAVFGEAAPRSYLGMGAVEDPFAVLRGRELPDAVVRSLAHVLLDEMLRRQGTSEGAYRFILGPAGASGRKLFFSWYPPRVYANQPPAGEQSLSGTVPGL